VAIGEIKPFGSRYVESGIMEGFAQVVVRSEFQLALAVLKSIDFGPQNIKTSSFGIEIRDDGCRLYTAKHLRGRWQVKRPPITSSLCLTTMKDSALGHIPNPFARNRTQ